METCRGTKCSDEELVLFYYGDLDEEARLRVESHISSCPACRSELADIERTLTGLSRSDVELSTLEIQRFAARVSSRAIRRRRRIALPALGGALAATAVLAVTLFTLQPGGGVAPQVSVHSKVSHVADADVVRNLDLLKNLDLLENLNTLQTLEGHG